MLEMSCPNCEAIRSVEEIFADETLTMKGQEITFKARFYRCQKCNGEFETFDQLGDNLRSAREVYARIKGEQHVQKSNRSRN